jgi:hypothetical protein
MIRTVVIRSVGHLSHSQKSIRTKIIWKFFQNKIFLISFKCPEQRDGRRVRGLHRTGGQDLSDDGHDDSSKKKL